MSDVSAAFTQAPKLVMYDLDGTLVDSVPDLAVAADFALQEQGFKPAGETRVRGWVGNGAEMLVRRALGFVLDEEPAEVPDDQVQALLTSFLNHYQVCSGQHSRLYAGVEEGLHRMAELGCEQVVITNKPARFVPDLLQQLGIDHYFSYWLGGDSLPLKKPDPDPLVHVLERYGVESKQALMVGDSINDIAAARAAGVPVLAVSYGYNHGRPVADEKPDWLTDHLGQFLQQQWV